MILQGKLQLLKYKSSHVMMNRLQPAMTSCAKLDHVLTYINADEHCIVTMTGVVTTR